MEPRLVGLKSKYLAIYYTMSLAALKRKSAALKNQSSGLRQFSINGTMRNQGYVGQSTQSRFLIHTPHKGAVAKGSGGCCGTYFDSMNIKPSEICYLEDSTVVKPSVLSTKGMLAKRNRWVGRPAPFAVVKPDSNHSVYSQSNYMEALKKKTLTDIDLYCPEPDPADTELQAQRCCNKACDVRNAKGARLFRRKTVACKISKEVGPKSQEDRLAKLNKECTKDDVYFVPSNIRKTTFVKL